MNFKQDWTPVVFKKKVLYSNKPPQSKPNEIDGEKKKRKVYSKEFADAVQKARLIQELTQAELSKRCNVLPSVINELEARKGAYDAQVSNKICSTLGIKVANRFVEV